MVGEVLGRRRRPARRGSCGRPATAAVEPLGDDVDLGAVAGREHDGLADVVAARPGRAAPWAGASPSTVIRSSRSSGTVRWFSPTTTTDTPGGAPWLRRSGHRSGSRSSMSGVERALPIEALGRTTLRPAGGSRSAASRSSRVSYSGPSSSSRRWPQPAWPAPGCGRPVETVTSSGALAQHRAGRVNEQLAGSSALLTQTPAASPSSKTGRLTAGSSVAATTSR